MKNHHWMWATLFLLSGCCLLSWNGVRGHGRLIEPPSRSSMWRYGFNTTANYNDHELYCGGFSRQYVKNGGKCGVCGDPWDGQRVNEAGGIYAQGILVRKYNQNSIIRIKVELTANHKGYFEFRLCPNNNPKKVVSQKCLDNYVLEQANGEGPRYYPSEGTRVYESRYILPKDMTCTQCVLQWRYIAGNNWGPCPNQTQAIGCGPQEEFRACADVAITDRSGHASSEEDDTEEDNVVDTDKLEGELTTTTTTESTTTVTNGVEPVVGPFFMAFVAFMVAVLLFGSLLGWFYRKEILEFTTETIGKINWKIGNAAHGLHSQNHSSPPVPPPRNKKFQSLHDSNGQMRQITPDVISQPIQVTINGLAVEGNY